MTAVITDRPTTLTAYHNYNLRNNGWPAEFSCSVNEQGETSPINTDPVTHTNTSVSFYPSLADIIYQAKAQAVKDAPNLGTYNPWQLRKFTFGNTPAPSGKFILNAFYRNRTEATGIPGLYDADRDLDSERCSSIEFYAGRIWYLKPDGSVLFSQIFTDITRADKCYQDADPTAEDINDIIDSDGGTVEIRDIGEGVKLIANQDSLFVFASNGVWLISGSTENGFTASAFQIRKLTTAGVISPKSVVLADNNIFYWSRSGIYVITNDQVTGRPTANNISEQSIQTKYLEIPEAGKRWCTGVYDSENRRIHWMYNDSSTYDGVNWRFQYNKSLVLDIVLSAFYDWEFEVGRLSDGLNTSIAGAVSQDEIGVTVTGEDDDRLKEVAVKYFVIDETSTDTFGYAWAEERDLSFKDFNTSVSSGIDFDSIIETGNDILQDPTIEKYGNDIYLYFERTENTVDSDGNLENESSCRFRVKWDWADSASSNKWSDLQQGYRFNRYNILSPSSDFDYGHDVIQTKSRIRGNGKAIKVRFESESGKDFKLLGWAIPFSGVPMQ